MAKGQPFFSSKETRLNLEPSFPRSTIAIRLPANGAANHSARTPQRRILHGIDLPTADDESSFAKRNLASASSIYFRQNKKHPRSFLWRVLDDGKVLSIQSVDLSKSSDQERDAALTLRLTFSSPIRPGGVCFADSADREPFSVFVLTASNDLYTLTLRPDFFRKSSATENNVEDWCKTYLSTSFSFRHPHRLLVKDPSTLLISIHDGGLLRLTRAPDDDGSSWTETFFSEGGWSSSFRSLIPWQGNQTVRYGNANLHLTTATSLVFSPPGSHNAQDHVFTASINHMIKGWNLSTGKICANKDLLGQERQPHDMLKYSIDPGQTNLLKVINQQLRGNRDHYYLVSYSPLGSGQFKFWAVGDGLQSDLDLQDLFPDKVFEPPAPSSEIWSMAQFEIVTTAEPGILTIKILWKNNTVYRLHSLEFDLMRVSEDWFNPWVATATETLRDEVLPHVSSAEAEDPTDKWCDYMFYPGRYTEATLATSLSIYEQNLNISRDSSSKRNKSIKELVCMSVGSSVSLGKSMEGGMDYHRYQVDTEHQWRRFYRIVTEIDKQRGEATALAIDEALDLSWIVAVDGIAAIRDCNETEILWHNRSNLISSPDVASHINTDSTLAQYQPDAVLKMAGLIQAAADFRTCFSDDLVHSCNSILQSEIWQDPSQTVPVRIRMFYERCDFAAHITDDDFDQLMTSIDKIGGQKALNTFLIESVVATIAQEKQLTASDVTLTIFGERAIVKGAQEIICLNSSILYNLLMLVVFMISEDDPDDRQLTGLDGSLVYVELLHLLKEYSVLQWLGKTACSEPQDGQTEDLGKAKSADIFRSNAPVTRSSSLLQYPWVRNWNPQWVQPRRSMAMLLTQSIKHVLADIGLSQSDNYNQQVMWLQRTLLRRGQLELAASFLRYQPNTAWSAYFKGRFYLATRDFVSAGFHFKKASFNLANREGALLAVNGTDDILNSTDGEFFDAGLPKYYSHIVALYEKEGAFSHVADFARIGLQSVFSSAQDDSNKSVRTELLNRLFIASINTCCFDSAYSALLQYTDKTLQRSALTHLVSKLCSSSNPNFHEHLLRLPFLHLQPEVDALLAHKCHTTLSLHSSPPYHQILYAWRLQRGDYRGAAEVLHDRLQRLKLVHDSRDGLGALTQTYLALINTLAVVGENEAWILAGGEEGGGGLGFSASSSKSLGQPSNGVSTKPGSSLLSSKGSGPGPASTTRKRRIVTINEIRKEYQAELDRVAMIENDRYAFTAMVDDEEEERERNGDIFGQAAGADAPKGKNAIGWGQDLIMGEASGVGAPGGGEVDGLVL
ncbi:MAG: 60S ribosomal protein L35 [Chaenotheca gracillima]|nr:MAG: 60S ribosomal protein L35 [Chaenotheca gracillima]